MHGHVYAGRTLQLVLESAGPDAHSPATVEVEAGEILGLTRESLAIAFGMLSKGTRAEGARLAVKFAKGSMECPKRGFAGRLPVARHRHMVDPDLACLLSDSCLRVVGGTEVKPTEIR